MGIANVLIELSRWIISSHCRAACGNNTFICHKTDHTPRAPLTRSVDLSPSTVPLRPVNHSTLESGDLFWRFWRFYVPLGPEVGRCSVWHRRVGGSSVHSLLWGKNETERRGGERLDRRIRWTARYPVYDSASLYRGGVSTSSVYRLPFRDTKDFTVSGWWSLRNFSTVPRSADRHRFDVAVGVEAAFTDDEPVYVMGRVTIARRIIRFTRVHGERFQVKLPLTEHLGRILRLTRKTLAWSHVI